MRPPDCPTFRCAPVGWELVRKSRVFGVRLVCLGGPDRRNTVLFGDRLEARRWQKALRIRSFGWPCLLNTVRGRAGRGGPQAPRSVEGGGRPNAGSAWEGLEGRGGEVGSVSVQFRFNFSSVSVPFQFSFSSVPVQLQTQFQIQFSL